MRNRKNSMHTYDFILCPSKISLIMCFWFHLETNHGSQDDQPSECGKCKYLSRITGHGITLTQCTHANLRLARKEQTTCDMCWFQLTER